MNSLEKRTFIRHFVCTPGKHSIEFEAPFEKGQSSSNEKIDFKREHSITKSPVTTPCETEYVKE